MTRKKNWKSQTFCAGVDPVEMDIPPSDTRQKYGDSRFESDLTAGNEEVKNC